jgi:hypothetical protein
MRSTLTSLALLALPALLASGCKEEPGNLFDERGVWAIEKYALDGGVLDDVPQERKNGFLLNFNPDLGVVAAAGCVSAESQTIESAICKTNPNAAYWECQCFAYTFEKDRMVWQSFLPGEMPPVVEDPTVEGSTAFEVLVEEFPALGLSYQFSPIPMGLFDSDGDLAKYVFQQKSLNVWDNPEVPGGDGNPNLEACSVGCFGPE